MAISVIQTNHEADAGVQSFGMFIVEGMPEADILVVAVQMVDSSVTDRVVLSVVLEDTDWEDVLNLIHIPGADIDDGAEFKTEFWYVVNSPALPNTHFSPIIRVNLAGKCTDVSGAAMFMNGIDKDNPIGAIQTGSDSGTAPTITVVTQNANSYVMDSLVSGESVGTKIRPYHTEIHKTDVGGDTTGSQYVDAGDAGNQIMNWYDDDADTPWIMSAVEIKVSAPPTAGKSFGCII